MKVKVRSVFTFFLFIIKIYCKMDGHSYQILNMLPNLRFDNSLGVESIRNFYNKEKHNPKGKREEW